MIKTYEFYVKVPIYLPIRCEAPDIGTAKDFKKRLQEILPEVYQGKEPEMREVENGSNEVHSRAEIADGARYYDWLSVASILGIIRDPGEELQYRE